MSESAFIKATSDLMFAVDEAFKKPAKLPAFILFYSSIDIFASLTRPITQEDTSGPIFKAWVQKYMIADTTPRWNADDIWGARCGLLHTFTIQSRSSRQGTARELQYIGDRGFCDHVQQELDPQAQKQVFVCLPDLIVSFLDGIMRFTKEVKEDTQLQAVVFHHADRLIIHETKKIS